MADRPADTAADVAALKDLMRWMRDEGYWCETITCGSVQLVTARDFLPSTKAQERAAAVEDDRARKSSGPSESAYAEFGRDMPGFEQVIEGKA